MEENYVDKVKLLLSEISDTKYSQSVCNAACLALRLQAMDEPYAMEIAIRTPIILSAMSVPLTMDECAFALVTLTHQFGPKALSASYDELANSVSTLAIETMRNILEDYEEGLA